MRCARSIRYMPNTGLKRPNTRFEKRPNTECLYRFHDQYMYPACMNHILEVIYGQCMIKALSYRSKFLSLWLVESHDWQKCEYTHSNMCKMYTYVIIMTVKYLNSLMPILIFSCIINFAEFIEQDLNVNMNFCHFPFREEFKIIKWFKNK